MVINCILCGQFELCQWRISPRVTRIVQNHDVSREREEKRQTHVLGVSEVNTRVYMLGRCEISFFSRPHVSTGSILIATTSRETSLRHTRSPTHIHAHTYTHIHTHTLLIPSVYIFLNIYDWQSRLPRNLGDILSADRDFLETRPTSDGISHFANGFLRRDAWLRFSDGTKLIFISPRNTCTIISLARTRGKRYVYTAWKKRVGCGSTNLW